MSVPINKLRQEEVLMIFSMLPYRDVISVGRTCRWFHDLSKDKVLLENVAKREMSEDCWKFKLGRWKFVGNCWKFVNDDEDEVHVVYPTREQINVALSLGSVIEIYFFYHFNQVFLKLL